jgi:hypothetical protein
LCECGFAAFLSAFRLLRCILAFGLRHLGVDLRIRRSSPGGALTANRQQRSALARTPTFSRSIPSIQGKQTDFSNESRFFGGLRAPARFPVCHSMVPRRNAATVTYKNKEYIASRYVHEKKQSAGWPT